MTFSTVRTQVVVRILLILSCGFLGAYFLWATPYSLMALWMWLATVIMTIALIRKVEKGRKDMADFLMNIRQRDFTPSYTRSGRENDVLHTAFETINQVFLNLHEAKEQQARYLQTVVEHVEVALVSYNAAGEVTLFNGAAQRLFGRQYLRQLSGLQSVDEALYETVRQLKAGEQRLVKFSVDQSLRYLAARATEFKLQQEHYTLVSFSDIGSELEAQEVESWQKLIRVLTHEIMNSAIPLTTLSEVTHAMLHTPQGQARPLQDLDAEEEEDLRGSLETIARRSKGLVSFVDAYRNLNQIPQPRLTQVPVAALYERVARLMQADFQEVELLRPAVPQDLTVLADAELLEQVLINLLSNAREAVQGRAGATVRLSADRLQDRVRMAVEDNGPGIDPEHLDQIFIPFFTTKAQGSGIGLALSRQIVQQHKGSLTVQTSPGEGARFVLEL